MRFIHPMLLWLLPVLVIALAGVLAYGDRRRRKNLTTFAGSGSRSWATLGISRGDIRLERGLVLATFVLLILALARPMVFLQRNQGELQGVPYLIALDASRSMLAGDTRPNRWAAATNALDRFLGQARADRVGLITFSGVAYLNAPLSFDMNAVRTTLRYIHPGSMTDPGSSLATAIERAGRYFASNQIHPKILILVTDGEDLEGNPSLMASRWARDGLQISCIGVGTTLGAKVPAGGLSGPGQAARNTFGQEVVSRLNEGNLQRIASATGGRYYRLGENGEGFNQLRTEFLLPLAEQAARQDLQNYKEWYSLPVCLAILCLLGRVYLVARPRLSQRPPSRIQSAFS
jgi:Ca-activated chloride channel family protein